MEALETQLRQQESRSATPSDSHSGDVDDGLTKLVHDLENQLETARNAKRLAEEKARELEQERKNLKNLEEVRWKLADPSATRCAPAHHAQLLGHSAPCTSARLGWKPFSVNTTKDICETHFGAL